jgi:hypothetical protein
MDYHNGGRSQLNFNFIQWGGAFPFINHLKTAQTWLQADGSGYALPTVFNANGYPENTAVYTVFTIPTQAQRPGDWVLRWTGTANLTVSGNSAVSGTDGELVWTRDGTSIRLDVNSGTPTDIVIMHEDDVAAYDAGGIFSAPFLTLLREQNWGVLRFLDWQQANITNVREWDDRKPEDYVFYHGDEIRESIYAGATTNVGEAYSVAAPPSWGGLVDKAIVTVRFNETATTNSPTLNVASTGAKTILGADGQPINHSSGRPYSTESVDGVKRYGTLIYDADIDGWIKFGGQINAGGTFLRNGAPIEVMLALCDEVGAHPWFCPPFLSCDPATDWMTELATTVKAYTDAGPTWMIPRYEVAPNETWNPGVDFYATQYAYVKAFDHWGTSNDANNWAGKVASVLGQAVSAVYSDDRTKYHAILGLQKVSGLPVNRIASTEYVADGGSAAYNWITHVAPSCYIRDTYSSAERTAAAAAYVAGNPSQQATEIANFLASTYINTGTGNYQSGLRWFVDVLVPSDLAAVQAYNPDIKITFYEGGWSTDYGSDTDLNTFYAAVREAAALEGVIYDLYMGLIRQADVECPSHYYLAGDGVWALFDPDIISATPSPQIEAIEPFNAHKRLYLVQAA